MLLTPEFTLYYVCDLPMEDGVEHPPAWAEPSLELTTCRAGETLGELTAWGSSRGHYLHPGLTVQ